MASNTFLKDLCHSLLAATLATVLASCGGGGSATPTTPITDAAPVFTSASAISVAENTTVTGYTAVATDANGDTVTFSLSGGEDQAAFSIDGASGALSFASAPDFEAPGDSDNNNSYVVEIAAIDGTNVVVQSVTVTVTNVANEAPVFTSADAISVVENTTVTGYTAVATDANGDTVTFSLSGGEDQAAFSIDGASGVLSFASAADFENPTDSDTNNSYVVAISATDGTSTTVLSVTVNVTDATNEAPVTAASPSLSFSQTKIFRFSWMDVMDATHYQLQENPDGVSGFNQVGADIMQGSETVDLVVPLYARVNAQYMLQSCNTDGCTASATVSVSDTLVAAIGYFKASNSGESDNFGFSLSLSADGSTLAVGAFGEASNATGINGGQGNNSALSSGATYVFTRSGSTWAQQAYLKASNSGATDQFGEALSLSADGSTLAVGARLEDSNATGINGDQGNNSAGDSGATYVFTRSGSTWTQQAYLKASNSGAFDQFGRSLSLSADGSTLAVGAFGEDSNATGINGGQGNNSALNSGATYVFTRSGTNWTQQAYLKASNSGASDFFGFSLSLSADGSTLAVGAFGEDSNATGINGGQSNNSASASGAAYVFIRSGSTNWTQQAYLKASNSGAFDFFGTSLSLSADGSTLAVGASFEDSNATGINGDQGNNSAGDSGATYVFTRSGSTWAQQAYLKASNSGATDQFGTSLSLSADGSTLAVGADREASNATGINGDQGNNSALSSGATYVFTRSGSTWTQQAYLKSSNSEAVDRFGRSLSLSADGSTLAVGADREDSNATGINGDDGDNSASNSGGLYLY